MLPDAMNQAIVAYLNEMVHEPYYNKLNPLRGMNAVVYQLKDET
jgi:hypothetical protein